MKPTVLVVDDKANMLTLLTKVLGKSARVLTARGVRTAIELFEREPVTVVLCDLRMNDGDGLEVLRAVRARRPGVPFILMTAYATVPTAVQAMREGAYDYVTKPFDPDELRVLVERAIAQAVVEGVDPPQGVDHFGEMVGRSAGMKAVYAMIERVAPTDATVLVLGETGTGKELIARAIHERSSRAAQRMVAVNCAAIPRALIESELFGHARGSFTGATADRAGLFEEASGSTLFLDEIGELRTTVQAKLTRVLEERSVRRIGEARERKLDVRLVAATQRDLRAMIRAGSFREDLWFRLNVCVIALPPLRARPDDIPLLAQRFLAEHAPHQGRSIATRFSAVAMGALLAHRWPGNVRELRAAVERAAILEPTREIRLESLPPEIQGVSPLKLTSASDVDLVQLTYREAVDTAREETNRRYIEAVLRRFRGDVAAAAAHAGIERESFYRLMRRCGLVAEDYRDDQREGSATKN
jgi:two-component system response regulator HydG